MEYIVLGSDKKEYGPIDGETLRKWVEHGRVFSDTKVRNSLMKNWNEAGKLDILADAFRIQEGHKESEEGVGSHLKDMLGLKHEPKPEEEVSSTYRLKHLPDPATFTQRVSSFFLDAFIFSLFALFLFFVMALISDVEVVTPDSILFDDSVVDSSGITIAENKIDPIEASSLNSTFYFLYIIFFTTIILYYGIGLGIYAQTVGMWFWGIIIVKNNLDEVLPAQAFIFMLLTIVAGPISPFIALFNPESRSLNDYIAGTMFIKVAAKTK